MYLCAVNYILQTIIHQLHTHCGKFHAKRSNLYSMEIVANIIGSEYDMQVETVH